jgi:hypothetical protein
MEIITVIGIVVGIVAGIVAIVQSVIKPKPRSENEKLTIANAVLSGNKLILDLNTLTTKDKELNNGDYKGESINGLSTDTGKLTYPNGDYYEGSFPEEGFTGFGRRTLDNGIYEGNFVSGDFSGKGKFTLKNGDIYEGDFADGDFNGIGKFTEANGNSYEGGVVGGKREGKGKFTLANGDWFETEFVDGNPVGEVTVYRPTGTTYPVKFPE